MDSSTCIEQKGVVEEISEGMVKVNIVSYSACADCHAKKACNFIDSDIKQIMVPQGNEDYIIGDNVRIYMKRSLGLKATLIAYIIPIFILIAALLLFTSFNMGELAAGILTLLILAPYFLIIYRFRDSLKNTFTFQLNKES